MRVVEKVHDMLIKLIEAEDRVIDATVGNGHDTLFLAKQGAHVIGFDIQEAAILKTKERIEGAGVESNVTLKKMGHEQMLEVIPENWLGKVKLVMFNLGYLPGGNKSVITKRNTTLEALDAAARTLQDGGWLSIVLYPDHPGGSEEADAVLDWVEQQEFTADYSRPNSTGPQWILMQKK